MKRPTQTVSQQDRIAALVASVKTPEADLVGRPAPQADPAGRLAPQAPTETRRPDALTVPLTESPAAPATRQRPELIPPREVRRQKRQAIKERKRYEREEVKRFTRRQRIRRRAWLIGAGVVVVVLGGAVATAFSPAMALKTVEVVGTHRIKASAVETALAGQLGKPLPLVDLGAVGQELSSFSLIRSYSTELEPPSTLVVRIDERTPLGVVKSDSGYALVDEAGVTVATSGTQPSGYPLITVNGGIKNLATAPAFEAVATVLAGLPSSLKATSASAATPQSVGFQLDNGKKVIWGGTADSALKLADLKVLLKSVPDAATYDVSSPQSPVTR